MRDVNKVREVFAQAVALPVAERPEYLAAACGNDQSVRAEVESLLAAADKEPEFMAAATKGGAPAITAESLRARIGPYKLLEEIGRGGFGTVYLAEQEQPVRRRVALKIITLGMDTRAVVARFEAERQVLAMMDHPHIAKVFDAGVTAPQLGGRPFFVMELVRGEPITTYADNVGLTISQRLDLFVQVCEAVQHAHSKGVIHRDIKPANIFMVGRTRPVVLDFGIAQLLHQSEAGGGAAVGSPFYAAPEQFDGRECDPRTDVYALGVVLYELLTGQRPYLGATLREIRESVRAARPRHPCDIDPTVPPPLADLALRALQIDPDQRPRTAGVMARELRAWLAAQPGQDGPAAGPPSGAPPSLPPELPPPPAVIDPRPAWVMRVMLAGVLILLLMVAGLLWAQT